MKLATRTLQKLNTLVDNFKNKNLVSHPRENIQLQGETLQMDKKGKGRKRLVLFFKATTIVSLLMYLGLSPLVATPLYYKVLFFPLRYPYGEYETIRAIDSVPLENVYFKSKNGNKLHGWYFHAPGSKYTALMHHGNGANVTYLGLYIDLFLKDNISILVYDYQGYGKSEGEPSLQNTVDDSRAAYKYLTKDLNIPPGNIIHVGSSFGTGLAGQLARSNPGRAVVLLTPYATLTGCARLRLPWLKFYPDFLMAGPDLRTVECAHNRKAPLFMVHGDDDWIVPVSQPDSLYAQAETPKEYLRMHNVGHGNYLNDEFKSRLSAFLHKL